MTLARQPERKKGADHFGYGFQVSLGKSASDGDGLWHSHGKHYHKPNTYWCGRWGDRTPEELLVECNSVIEDMRIYHPELFEAPHTSAQAPDVKELFRKEIAKYKDEDPLFMAYVHGQEAAAKAAREQAEATDNILTVLKKRYRKEMAIIDYVEMIECEVESLRQPEPQQEGRRWQN